MLGDRLGPLNAPTKERTPWTAVTGEPPPNDCSPSFHALDCVLVGQRGQMSWSVKGTDVLVKGQMSWSRDRCPGHGDRCPGHGDRCPGHGDRCPGQGTDLLVMGTDVLVRERK